MECLIEDPKKLSALTIHKRWFNGLDKRYTSQAFQKFLDYNKESFNFLGVIPVLEGSDSDLLISFKSSAYVGSVPLRSPENGKLMGDFQVFPRYVNSTNKFEEYISLIDIIGKEVQPEFNDSLELTTTFGFTPPRYLEAIKFIDLLSKLIDKPWQKFNLQNILSPNFAGNINWKKYIEDDYNPQNKFRVPASISALSEDHLEYSKIKYVFELAKADILNKKTPLKIQCEQLFKINRIENKLNLFKPIQTKGLKIHQVDNLLVREAKKQANIILNYRTNTKLAWRVDYSSVFEKSVQYIFKELANEIGGSSLNNFFIPRKGKKYNGFELLRLEPDIVFSKDKTLYFIDAKYKAHLFNRLSTSQFLKEEYRKDLHQILAYSSFSSSETKEVFLCYPSNKEVITKSNYFNPLSNNQSIVYVVGIPLTRESFALIKQGIKKIIAN
jgi:hypothetical protein